MAWTHLLEVQKSMVFHYKCCDMLGSVNCRFDSDVMVGVISNHVVQ